MQTNTTSILLRPEERRLGFLPEGPYDLGDERISWVSIQEHAKSTAGSLNILEISTGQNHEVRLGARPGFAFPTTNPEWFVVGVERHIALVNSKSGEQRRISDEVDTDRDGTIINDGTLCSAGIIFGCKDTTFTEHKAGLYLFRSSNCELVRLLDSELCSNGKVILQDDGTTIEFLNIDTPTKKVVRYELDVAAGKLGSAQDVLDLNSVDSFPDGMVGTPGLASVIIAMFNPESVDQGEAREYDLASGDLKTVWTTPGSPQVTCPLLLQKSQGVSLVLTTAWENMSPEKLANHPNAGCLFEGTTSFDSLPTPPIYPFPES